MCVRGTASAFNLALRRFREVRGYATAMYHAYFTRRTNYCGYAQVYAPFAGPRARASNGATRRCRDALANRLEEGWLAAVRRPSLRHGYIFNSINSNNPNHIPCSEINWLLWTNQPTLRRRYWWISWWQVYRPNHPASPLIIAHYYAIY